MDIEENSSIFCQSECTSGHQQGRAGSKTSLQQNSPLFNYGCWLMYIQVVVVAVVAVAVVVIVAAVVVLVVVYLNTFAV